MQVDNLELLIFRQWRVISRTFRRLDPLDGIRAREISRFTASQFVIEDVVAVKVDVPAIRMAVSDLHSTDIADFMRPVEQILDAAMAARFAPNLLRHPDHVLERVRTLVTHRQSAEHHAPSVRLAMFHDRFHIIEARGLNLVVADRAHPHGTTSLQAAQSAAVFLVPEEADTSGVADRTAAFCRSSTSQKLADNLPLLPAISTKFCIGGERNGRGIGGRITCIAIKGGYAAHFTHEPRNVAFRAFPQVCYTLF